MINTQIQKYISKKIYIKKIKYYKYNFHFNIVRFVCYLLVWLDLNYYFSEFVTFAKSKQNFW